MIGMWHRAWEDFVPFLQFPPEVRRLVYTSSGARLEMFAGKLSRVLLVGSLVAAWPLS